MADDIRETDDGMIEVPDPRGLGNPMRLTPAEFDRMQDDATRLHHRLNGAQAAPKDRTWEDAVNLICSTMNTTSCCVQFRL